jgi:uncharacterized protein (DUF433 family)
MRPSLVLTEGGLIADEGYSYADLTLARIIKALRDKHLDFDSAARALHHMYERLGPPDRGWANEKVYVVGNRIYVDRPDEWEITDATELGQKVMETLFGELFEELREIDEEASIIVPPQFREYVQVKPQVMGGEPVIRDTRIPTATVVTLCARYGIDKLKKLYRRISSEKIEKQLSTSTISIDNSQWLSLERFLLDSDTDPELINFLRKVGFRATHATWHNIPNDDTQYLIWARKHGYILLCHDKHRDAKTKYAFYSELYYRGGQVIRVGKPGYPLLYCLGCVLAQRYKWQKYFESDSGEVVVHSGGCNFTNAEKLLRRSSYKMRLPFEDPSIPLKTRKSLPRPKGKQRRPPPNIYQSGLDI